MRPPDHDDASGHPDETPTDRDQPRPSSLLTLLLTPSRFFRSVELDSPRWIGGILWAWGVTETSGRIDQNLIRSELGQPRPGWEELAPTILGGWLPYWGFLLALGVLGGAVHWYVGGWWYRVRLKWSGAPDPDPRLARLTMTWAGAVLAIPNVLFLVGVTAVFDSYEAYWASDELWSTLLILPPFWSVAVSYSGVRTNFAVGVWKSRVWFLILPAVLYAGAVGLIGVMYAFFG